MAKIELKVIPVIASVAFILNGCTTVGETLGSKARVNPNMVASHDHDSNGKRKTECPLVYGDSTSWKGVINLECFAFPNDEIPAYQVAAGHIKPAHMPTIFDKRGILLVATKPIRAGSKNTTKAVAVQTATNSAVKDVHSYYRNRLEEVLIKRSDDICTIEKGKIFANEATTNAGLGIFTTGLSTVSSIVTGDLAKSILSGGAAFTSSSRDHINANVWKNQLTTAITNSIDVSRSKLLEDILPLRTKDIYSYNVDDMVRRVNQYHQACSLNTGLQSLLTASANQKRFTRLNERYEVQNAINSLMGNIYALERQKAKDVRIDPLRDRLKELMLKAAEIDAPSSIPEP